MAIEIVVRGVSKSKVKESMKIIARNHKKINENIKVKFEFE